MTGRHVSERLGEVRFVGHEAGMAKLKDRLGGWAEHLVAQLAIEHSI
jgi:hypothetical protein